MKKLEILDHGDARFIRRRVQLTVTHSKTAALFILVGAISTMVHYFIMAICIFFQANSTLATSIGAANGAIAGYILNKKITFKSNKKYMEEIPKYILIVLTGILLNGFVFYFTLKLIKLPIIFSQGTATSMTLIWNYLANKNWTFRDSND